MIMHAKFVAKLKEQKHMLFKEREGKRFLYKKEETAQIFQRLRACLVILSCYRAYMPGEAAGKPPKSAEPPAFPWRRNMVGGRSKEAGLNISTIWLRGREGGSEAGRTPATSPHKPCPAPACPSTRPNKPRDAQA